MSWKAILKSYELEEFIVKAGPKRKPKKPAPKKAEKAAKETVVDLGMATVTVVTTASMAKLIKDIEDWHTKCNSLKLESIGIKGKKKASLLEHCMFHVDKSVQRPRQPRRHGAMGTLKDIMKIVREVDAYSHKDLETVDDFVEDLEEIEGTWDTNPRNIVFTERHDPTDPEDKTIVHGHYRTEWYSKNGKDKPDAVPSEWYSESLDTATPPFWQALFASPQEQGDTIPLGLKHLLESFAAEMVKQPLTDLTVKGRRARENIEQMAGFTGGLKTILRNQEVYRSATVPFDRLWVNFAAVQRKLTEATFQVQGRKATNAMNKLLGLQGDDKKVGILKDWSVKNISIQLLRTIITNHRGINLDSFKHGSNIGIFLKKPITVGPTGDKSRMTLWDKEYAKANRQGNVPFWAKPKEDPPSGGGSSAGNNPNEPKKDSKKDPNVKKSWFGILKSNGMGGLTLRNPASEVHAPKVFSVERQEQISEQKKETCDYCEKPVALDCSSCNQKLCREHIDIVPCKEGGGEAGKKLRDDKGGAFGW